MAETSRSQEIKLQTGKKRKTIIFLLIAVAVIVSGVIIVIAKVNSGYKPPKFDENQISGVPKVEESYMYKSISSDFGYSFSMAANIYQQEDSSLLVYFTNPKGSDINLMIEINEKKSGDVLYRSGVIKPGYYVERLQPQFNFENKAMEVDIKVYSFEPDTWYSLGTTDVGLTLQPW